MHKRLTLFLAWAFVLFAADAAAGAERSYQLVGRVLGNDGTPMRGSQVIIFVQSSLTPFSVRSLAEADGSYRVKNLRPGIYTLIIAVPMTGEITRTVEIGPSFADSRGRVVINIVYDRKPDAAAKTISSTTLSIPAAAKAQYLEAQACLARHDTQGAIARLKKAVELAPQFSVALNNLGTIAYQERRYGEAESYFREALKQEPDHYAPLVNLGGALLSEGRFAESLEYNLLAVKARPEDALARSQLGQSYFFLNELDKAEVELKKAKSLDPAHFSFPQLVLAEIYARMQNPGSALRELEEFLRLHPDSDRAAAVRNAIQKLRGKAG